MYSLERCTKYISQIVVPNLESAIFSDALTSFARLFNFILFPGAHIRISLTGNRTLIVDSINSPIFIHQDIAPRNILMPNTPRMKYFECFKNSIDNLVVDGTFLRADSAET